MTYSACPCCCCCCCCECHCSCHRHQFGHDHTVPYGPHPAPGSFPPPVPPPPHVTGRPVAQLIKPLDTFTAGEARKLYWLPVRAPLVLYISPASVAVEIFYVGGAIPPPSAVRVLGESERFAGVHGVAFLETMEVCFLRVSRHPEWLDEPAQLELALRYADPTAAYSEEVLTVTNETGLQTPLLHFPDGTEAFEVPASSPYKTFPEYVAAEYSTLLEGVTSALYELAVQLPLVRFPIAGADGPAAPTGAQHNENYCGISAFIHSMQNRFPGALPPNAGTDPTEWDRVGDALDHGNTLGEKGNKMVDNVNKNFRDKQGATNGKRYCAEELDDKSAPNLAAKGAHCDLKLLIYDLPTFGHWVDVTSVAQTATGVDLTCQDYGDSYTVPYNPSNDAIDFTNAAGSTMGNRGKKFGGKNPFERIYFVAVCECTPPPH